MFPLQNAFRQQTQATLPSFLEELALCPDIFSTFVDTDEETMDIYMYAAAEEVVFLGIDKQTFGRELADENPFYDEDPLYFSENAHRKSPLHRLRSHVTSIKEIIDITGVPHVSYILVTGSTIINKEDMLPTWHGANAMVIDGTPLEGKLLVNKDFFLASSCYYAWYLATLHGPSMQQNEDLAVYNASTARRNKDVSTEQVADLLADMPGVLEDDDHMGKDKTDDMSIDQDTIGTDGEGGDETIDQYIDRIINEPSHNKPSLPTGIIEISNDRFLHLQVLPPMLDPQHALSRLVGCHEIRSTIMDLIDLSQYNTRLREVSPTGRRHQVSLHAIFAGGPGTGKTTVGKIYGSLLHEAGVLSKGHVIVCDRANLIGNCHGDEEVVVRALLRQAKGGVLVIDEAYQLNGAHPSDPGKQVLPLFMSALADERERDFAVILCGYPSEMDRLLELNPGLHSRFPNRFDFPDFTVAELMEIARRRVSEYGYHFTRSAWTKFRRILVDARGESDGKSWGNARFVANLLEHVYLRHAHRCLHLPDDKLLSITAADVEPIPLPARHRSIGFHTCNR